MEALGLSWEWQGLGVVMLLRKLLEEWPTLLNVNLAELFKVGRIYPFVPLVQMYTVAWS